MAIREYITQDAAKITFWLVTFLALFVAFLGWLRIRLERNLEQKETQEIIVLTQLIFKHPALESIFKDGVTDVSAAFNAIDNLDMPGADKEFVKGMLIKDLADEITSKYKSREEI